MRFFCALFAALTLAAGGAFAANEVKIEHAHGLLWTTVSAKGQSFHFVIDTGASVTVLSPEAARRLDMPWGRPTRVEAIGGTARGYQSSEFPGLLAGLALPSKVLVMDLSGPSQSCGRVIDGLIGADFFLGKIAQLDYQAGTLRFLDHVPAGANAVPSRFESGVICLRLAPVGSKAGWARLDTGCTDALHWTDRRLSRASTPPSIALASSNNAAVCTSVQIGDQQLERVPVVYESSAFFSNEAGLAGNPLLSHFRVTIDGIRRRLYLER